MNPIGRLTSAPRERADRSTLPARPLPDYADPIWQLGSAVVTLLVEYLDMPESGAAALS